MHIQRGIHNMPYLIGAGAIALIGLGGKLAGDGINSAASGGVKIAIAGGAGYYLLKKTKVI